MSAYDLSELPLGSATLDLICVNCGERAGAHALFDSRCPEKDNGVFTDFVEGQKFKASAEDIEAWRLLDAHRRVTQAR